MEISAKKNCPNNRWEKLCAESGRGNSRDGNKAPYRREGRWCGSRNGGDGWEITVGNKIPHGFPFPARPVPLPSRPQFFSTPLLPLVLDACYDRCTTFFFRFLNLGA